MYFSKKLQNCSKRINGHPFGSQLNRMMLLVFYISLVCVFSSCSHVKTGTTALINGKVYTVNPKMPWAEAVVVDSAKIIFVGSTADAKKYIGEQTKVVDLQGKMVLPGFVESHIHLALSNFMSQSIFLDANGNREQWLDAIRKTVKENPTSKYFLFSNFRPIIFGSEGPQKEDLDAIDKTRPIVVLDGSVHSAWVNSKAFEIAGITRETPDPLPGGHYFKRDKQGNPSGFCIEPMTFIPILMKLGITQQELMAAMGNMFPMLSAYGFTSVFDAGSFMQTDMYTAYLNMEKEGKLPFRVFECFFLANPNEISGAVDHLKAYDSLYHSPLLQVNTMKILLDGVLDAKSCAMFDDFPGGEGNGFVLMPPDQLNDLVLKSDDAGFNIHIHGVGNRAISDAIGAFEYLKEKKGFTPTRKTVCHNTFFMPNTIQRYKDLRDVVAQTTPIWFIPDPKTLALVGKEVYEHQYLFNSMEQAGIVMSCGSDYPVGGGFEDVNPFREIEVGHMRRYIGAPDNDILPPASEKLSLESLIKGYTWGGAYQLGVEDKIGSIEVGKFADIIILEKNIFEQKTDDIHTNKVVWTMMDGRVVHNILN